MRIFFLTGTASCIFSSAVMAPRSRIMSRSKSS
nr:MAG TPA: hypothetical protein [Caudoviricetes sp.]